MSLSLIINGKASLFEELEPGATVLRLVEVLGLKPDRIALEIDGQIAARGAWGAMPLADAQRLELVHFVGGGTESSRKELRDTAAVLERSRSPVR